jgi:radical SAM superfamily enzyme YgiQ (UPF0313 family)
MQVYGLEFFHVEPFPMPLDVLLISTYELGRQPFGLASPAAWLRARGARVACMDLSRDEFREDVVREANLIAFYVPMHTATRLAIELLGTVRALNPGAHICFYGLYASVNAEYLRKSGVETILGGEFEEGLTSLAKRLGTGKNSGANARTETQTEPVISLARQNFIVPDRTGMPPLDKYARLLMPNGERRLAGYTEASRGCKHLCKHCPVVPVYNGIFRVVERAVVLEDIRRQVAAGARHITFGDPDFFNGIGHAIPLVESLHREFPELTYDATIKIEHLLKHSETLAILRDTGCLFVISAVESVDDAILEKLDKHHTRADFIRVARLFRDLKLVLQPTFVPFTPWTTLDSFCELLITLRENDLIENVAPIQMAIRLLIPAGSLLMELPDIKDMVEPFDEAALVYPWRHADARVDQLCEALQEIVHRGEKLNQSRSQIFARIEEAAFASAERARPAFSVPPVLAARATIPYLNEPWYC